MEIKHIENNELRIEKDECVLIDFFATWCGPCKMLGPVLEKIKDKIQIVKIDVDINEQLARQHGVMSVPTLMIMKNNKIVATKVGFVPEPLLIKWIEENI